MDRMPCPEHRFRTLSHLEEKQLPTYGATPNNAPTPAVIAMASAPQKVTRIAALITGAPPARAASEPSSASDSRALPETAQSKVLGGTSRTISKGIAAPAEKLVAEVHAA